MKKLLHKRIDEEFILNPDHHYNLVIENPYFYRSFIYNLNAQLAGTDELFLFYLDGKEAELSKYAYFIDNPINIPLDRKKADSLVQKEIALKTSQENKIGYQRVLNSINEFLINISYDYSLPISFDEEMPLSSFLKAMGVKVEDDDTASFLDNLIFKIKEISYLFGCNIFFFTNLNDYLTEEEMNTFHNEMAKGEIDFMIISSHSPISKPAQEKLIIIDKDLCELHID